MRPNRVALVGLAVCLAGCGASEPDPGPRFDDEGRQEITCMIHQPAAPGPRYTDVDLRETDDTLLVLRYYTAHADKPYCDGAEPTDTDRKWAQLYVDLGADPTKVESLLD